MIALRRPRKEFARFYRARPQVIELRWPRGTRPHVNEHVVFDAPHLALRVISSVERDDARGETFWYVSVSARPGGRETRPRDDQMALVREHFGMELADEDNVTGHPHVRHLWLAVQPEAVR